MNIHSPAAVLIYLALSACRSGTSDAPSVPPVPADEPALSRGPGLPYTDAVPAPLLEKVRMDAAKRTGVPLSEVEIVTAEKITWDDGSLGCPQPDRMYTQALVPGYQIKIRIRSADDTLDYHAAEAGQFVLCSLPQVRVDDHEVR